MTTPSPLNFKLEIKTTNHIPDDNKTPPLTTTKPLPASSITRQPSPTTADKPESKAPFMVRGYEIAPRFQRLLQRKVEAREQKQCCSHESGSSNNSHTERSSVTPPGTPSPDPYDFTASSISSAHSSSSRTSPTDNIFYPPPSEPFAPTLMSYSPVKVGCNGFVSAATPALTATKHLPTPSTIKQPSPPAAEKPESKAPFMVKGYEIATRFHRLLQRKVETKEQEQCCSQELRSSSKSHTARSSVTPPRTKLNAKTLSQQLESAQSSKEYVEIYAKINNLALKYSTNTIGRKKPNKGYVTVLTLGDHKHLSYPDIAQSDFEAEEIAAQKAVKKIRESLGNGVPTRSVVICDDNNFKIRICR